VEINGELHASASLHLEKENPVHAGKVTGKTPEPFWTFRK
jgi:hypothetical protein